MWKSQSHHRRSVTVAEYLRAEERSDIRHEFVRGEVYAMSGGTSRHSQIAGNFIRYLGNAARGTGCRVYTSDFKVQPTDEAVYYPDVSLACGFHDGSDVLTTTPCLIVEVTSRSTVRTDRGEKAQQYCQCASLRAYLIVDQNRKRVTLYSRDEQGEWDRSDVEDSGTIPLGCVPGEITLDQIYEDVLLPPLGAAEPEVDAETGEYVTTK